MQSKGGQVVKRKLDLPAIITSTTGSRQALTHSKEVKKEATLLKGIFREGHTRQRHVDFLEAKLEVSACINETSGELFF